jgi:hypothetical protein
LSGLPAALPAFYFCSAGSALFFERILQKPAEGRFRPGPFAAGLLRVGAGQVGQRITR